MAERSGQDAGRPAFTLVELLVVVSIIALLLSLLMPSLRQFREHARTVACQSQIAGIGKCLISYALDLDSFPITSDETGMPVSWRYGGWSGSNGGLWKGFDGGSYYIPSAERPVSAYMYRPSQLGETERLPMFRCPSDAHSRRVAPMGLDIGDMSAYEDIGTSYHLNWHWFELQTRVPGIAQDDNRDIDRVRRGQRVWWKYMQRNAARFVTLLEDPADYALAKHVRIEGNHRKFSKHNFAFLDGHAEYLYADTRYLRGADWTVVDEAPPYEEWLPDR